MFYSVSMPRQITMQKCTPATVMVLPDVIAWCIGMQRCSRRAPPQMTSSMEGAGTMCHVTRRGSWISNIDVPWPDSTTLTPPSTSVPRRSNQVAVASIHYAAKDKDDQIIKLVCWPPTKMTAAAAAVRSASPCQLRG